MKSKSGTSLWSGDEFLNFWNNDENQVITSKPRGQEAICKKTLDEVWSEIQMGQPKQQESKDVNVNNHEPPLEQPTVEEMTLEDFLVEAGVVQDWASSSISSQQTTAMPSQNPNAHPSTQKAMEASGGVGQTIGFGFPEQNMKIFVPSYGNVGICNQMCFQGTRLFQGSVDSNTVQTAPSKTETSGTNDKNITVDGPTETAVERWQRRMVKNRESAARSRARRQAYAVELEAALTQLKQENEKLKQVLAEAEKSRNEKVFKRKVSTKSQRGTEKLKKLRRTLSSLQ